MLLALFKYKSFACSYEKLFFKNLFLLFVFYLDNFLVQFLDKNELLKERLERERQERAKSDKEKSQNINIIRKDLDNKDGSNKINVNKSDSIKIQSGDKFKKEKEELDKKKREKIERISGSNRIETSVILSEKEFDRADTVFIASASNFADALSASTLVSKHMSPVLLVSESDSGMLNAEFARGFTGKKLIVGGIGSVSRKTEYALGSNVERFEGINRYETARKIAKEVLGEEPIVYVSTGENYADAMTAGPAVIKDKAALVLVNENNKSISGLKKDMYVKKINVIGGQASISKRIFDTLLDDIQIRTSKQSVKDIQIKASK